MSFPPQLVHMDYCHHNQLASGLHLACSGSIAISSRESKTSHWHLHSQCNMECCNTVGKLMDHTFQARQLYIGSYRDGHLESFAGVDFRKCWCLCSPYLLVYTRHLVFVLPPCTSSKNNTMQKLSYEGIESSHATTPYQTRT